MRRSGDGAGGGDGAEAGRPGGEGAPGEPAFLAKATPALRALVARRRAEEAPARVAAWLRHLEVLHDGFAVALALLPPGARRAEVLHLVVTRELFGLNGQRPSCHRACAACCHFQVEVTLDEAALLAEQVRAGVTVDRALLAAQAARRRDDPAWSMPWSAGNRCVFLGEDLACRVYAWRPAACRKLLVTSPPAECARPGGAVAALTVPLAEVALTAMLGLPGTAFTSLPRALQDLL